MLPGKITLSGNKIKKFYVNFILENQSSLTKPNKDIDWKEMDDIKLFIEIEALSCFWLSAMVAI